LAIVEYGVVKSFHIINRGSVDMTNSLATALNVPFSRAEELKRSIGLLGKGEDKNISDIIKVNTDFIFSEVDSVILNYQKKYNKTIEKVILTGGGALLKGIKEVAVENLRTEVSMGNPFSRVETPAFLDKVLGGIGPEFTVALGLALRKLK
jgi:type IV pilus assembly protein PilM